MGSQSCVFPCPSAIPSAIRMLYSTPQFIFLGECFLNIKKSGSKDRILPSERQGTWKVFETKARMAPLNQLKCSLRFSAEENSDFDSSLNWDWKYNVTSHMLGGEIKKSFFSTEEPASCRKVAGAIFQSRRSAQPTSHALNDWIHPRPSTAGTQQLYEF